MRPEISVHALADALNSNQPPAVLDVREPWEVSLASLPGAIHIPLNLIPVRSKELPNRPLVVVCHHGVRSLHAARFLLDIGFEDVTSLAGGLDAWAQEIDPTMTRY